MVNKMTELFLFGDTETTDFAKSGPLIQEGQARVCQVAFILTDDTGKSLAEFSSLVKPDGWKVGEGAAKIHGFTTEMCEEYGLEQKNVMNIYFSLLEKASIEIYHNSSFDKRMLAIEESYMNPQWVRPTLTKQFCTMLESTNVCKLPSPRGGYKWPKLSEALKIVCNKELGEQAHDALWDARACRDIFFGLRERKAA